MLTETYDKLMQLVAFAAKTHPSLENLISEVARNSFQLTQLVSYRAASKQEDSNKLTNESIRDTLGNLMIQVWFLSQHFKLSTDELLNVALHEYSREVVKGR